MKLIIELSIDKEKADKDLNSASFEVIRNFTKQFEECKTAEDLQNLFYLSQDMRGFFAG
jgi:hypothetical protein